MSNIIVDTSSKTKKRGKIRKEHLGFQASREFAGLVDRAARELTNGNGSEYMRAAVLDRMIDDGIVSRATEIDW